MRRTLTPTLSSSSLSLRAEGRRTGRGGKKAHAIALGFIAGFFVLTGMAAEASPVSAPATPSMATSEVAVSPRDLLAHGNDNQYWIAQVRSVAGENAKYDQTSISYRNTFGDWTAMTPVVGRVVSMADSSGELLFVFESGQWEIMDADEVRTGPPPPGESMVAIGNDVDTVWAVVHGKAPATAPSTNISDADASTQPTTAASVVATQPDDNRFIVCKFESGKWGNVYSLPEGIPAAPAQVSFAVINQLPAIAWTPRPGLILVSRLTTDHVWTQPVSITRVAPARDFKLLNLENNPALWIASSRANASTLPSTRPTIPDSAGELLTGVNFSISTPLQFKLPQSSPVVAQDFAVVGGVLRWLGSKEDGSIAEQTFDLSGKSAQQSVVAGPRQEQIVLSPWLGGAALLLVGSVVAAIRQKTEPTIELPRSPDLVRLRLAPLGIRFAAGLVDLAPLVAVAAIVHPVAGAYLLSGINVKSFQSLCELATLTYLLHTTLAEMICGQSLGKMLFGLRVVTTDGGKPTPLAILSRNLLRLLDIMLMGLPLLAIIFLPLRQRAGDLVGGTVVIARESVSQSDSTPD